MHKSKRCLHLLGGMPDMHELETCLVDMGVIPTEPCACATNAAVSRCHGHVLGSRHAGYLRKNAIFAMHVRLRERKHKSSSRRPCIHTPSLEPKMADSTHAHTFGEICGHMLSNWFVGVFFILPLPAKVHFLMCPASIGCEHPEL